MRVRYRFDRRDGFDDVDEAECVQRPNSGVECIGHSLLQGGWRFAPGDDGRIGAGELVKAPEQLRRRYAHLDPFHVVGRAHDLAEALAHGDRARIDGIVEERLVIFGIDLGRDLVGPCLRRHQVCEALVFAAPIRDVDKIDCRRVGGEVRQRQPAGVDRAALHLLRKRGPHTKLAGRIQLHIQRAFADVLHILLERLLHDRIARVGAQLVLRGEDHAVLRFARAVVFVRGSLGNCRVGPQITPRCGEHRGGETITRGNFHEAPARRRFDLLCTRSHRVLLLDGCCRRAGV